MRAGPVDPVAGAAMEEAFLCRSHGLRQQMDDTPLLGRFERDVAPEAQRERPRLRGKRESSRDFAQLRLGLERVHVAAARDVAALEQLALAREPDAPLPARA